MIKTSTACFTLMGSSGGNLMVKLAVEVLILCFYCNCMYFAQRPIFEHSVSGVGNLSSHVQQYFYQCRVPFENTWAK